MTYRDFVNYMIISTLSATLNLEEFLLADGSNEFF